MLARPAPAGVSVAGQVGLLRHQSWVEPGQFLPVSGVTVHLPGRDRVHRRLHDAGRCPRRSPGRRHVPERRPREVIAFGDGRVEDDVRHSAVGPLRPLRCGTASLRGVADPADAWGDRGCDVGAGFVDVRRTRGTMLQGPCSSHGGYTNRINRRERLTVPPGPVAGLQP